MTPERQLKLLDAAEREALLDRIKQAAAREAAPWIDPTATTSPTRGRPRRQASAVRIVRPRRRRSSDIM